MINNNIKIVAITVTYNSAKSLIKTIDALLSQTYIVSNIIIVDNASDNDNVRIINDIKSKSENIKVIRLKNNSGGAGGFETGMRYVDSNINYDYIWLMDDDAFPSDNCLENLLRYKDLKNVGALCPLIFGIDNNEYQLYHHKNLKRLLTKDDKAYKNYEVIPEVGKVEANAFVGPLIPRNVVKDIGFPDGRLFIYGDDTEYTYRISRKYNCYLIKAAIINHKDVNAAISINPESLWKDYYMYRNRLLLVNVYLKNKFYKTISNLITYFGIVKRILFIKAKFDHKTFVTYEYKIKKAFILGINNKYE